MSINEESDKQQQGIMRLKAKLRDVIMSDPMYLAEIAENGGKALDSVYALLELAVEIAPDDSSFIEEALAEVIYVYATNPTRITTY